MRKFIKSFLELTSDKSFMHMIEVIEVIVAKLLSLLMVIVILATLGDLFLRKYFLHKKVVLARHCFKLSVYFSMF
jgi:hypothetical protein